MYPEKKFFLLFPQKKNDGEEERESWEGGDPGNVYLMSNDIVLALSNKLWGLEWCHGEE